MAAPFVALDLGNSRLKAGWFDAEGRLRRTRWAPYETFASMWEAWTAEDGDGTAQRAVASSVRAGERGRAEVDSVRRVLGVPLELNPDPGLLLDVESPETVGFDRLYASRGALERGRTGAVVLDAGTALTVDAVVPGGEDEAGSEDRVGRFLGGAIAPGPELLARSLAGADQLYRVDPSPGAPALGKDTRRALEAGVVHTIAGGALRLALAVAAESGLERPRFLVTGGARAFVLPALVEAGLDPLEVPDLVLEGLAACVDGAA